MDDFILLSNGKYRCKCGSEILKKSVYNHKKTQKHKKYLEDGENIENVDVDENNKKLFQEKIFSEECGVCLETTDKFFTCKKCGNKHCMLCYEKVNKCPYCRDVYRDVSEEVYIPDEEDEYYDSEYEDYDEDSVEVIMVTSDDGLTLLFEMINIQGMEYYSVMEV